MAASTLLSRAHPDVEISAFAFGKIQYTGSTPFPKQPEFPTQADLTLEGYDEAIESFLKDEIEGV